MIRRKTAQNESSSLAIPFLDCPAKTLKASPDVICQGRSVFEHCLIVGEVAKEIIARFPFELKERLFSGDVPLIAAVHDVGKVSPCFVEKLRRQLTTDDASFACLKDVNPDLERKWGGHPGVSEVAMRGMGAPGHVAEIAGQHHGFTPQVYNYRANDNIFGGIAWQKERVALVEELKKALALDWLKESVSFAELRLYAGLTTVSDWIGSGDIFEDPGGTWNVNISKAVDAAGFISPTYRPSLTFEDVFGFKARTLQQCFIDHIAGPGVYILEAPMGNGKTEAALYAAYQILAKGKANGIYFALPTQLTSNKIFERFENFLANILTKDCKHRSRLLHSKAWLVDTQMGEDASPGGSWFNNKKRGLLAPFAVGTVDQALMASMNVRHGFVRAFGLAGKVVVLDEVHSYDTYTGTLLDALIELLRALHCTVIVLSATLHKARREELLQNTFSCDRYPLITAIPYDDDISEVSVDLPQSHEIILRTGVSEQKAIEEVLVRAAEGQQVLWIENTVGEAQASYLNLAARAAGLGISCGLLHSRFTLVDRNEIEENWINLFGVSGWATRGSGGRILVGTQVLEQSLDIDADFMISRFAPSDMLLQRLGRLWRHDNTPRNQCARCEGWLISPQAETAINSPFTAFGPSAYVYSPYVLCRSIEVWRNRKSIVLPEDIRAIVELTYSERQEEGEMGRWLSELQEGTRWRRGLKAMKQLASVSLAEKGKTLPEAKAQTRYSETDNVDVLLLRSLEFSTDTKSSAITLLSGDKLSLPWDSRMLSNRQWRRVSAVLMNHIVPIRAQDAPLQLPIDTLRKYGFHNCFYLGKPEYDEALLRVALVEQAGHLTGVHGAPLHDKFLLDYRKDLGYRVMMR